MTALLEIAGLHAHYDKSHILHGVHLSIRAGETVSLLGRNGSGRSTTLKTIMGLVQPSAGSVRLAGVDLAGERAFRIARAGLAYVPEEREIFANLTVDENLRIGMQAARPGVPRWTPEQMYGYFPQLKERRHTQAGMLSGNRLSGCNVENSKGESLGRIEDIIIDEESGRVVYALLSFGGPAGQIACVNRRVRSGCIRTHVRHAAAVRRPG